MIRSLFISIAAVLLMASNAHAIAETNVEVYDNKDGARITAFNKGGLYTSWVDLGRDGYKCQVRGKTTGAVTAKAVTNSTGTGTYSTLAANPSATISSTGPDVESFAAQRYVFIAWSANTSASDFIQLDCMGDVGRTFTLCDAETVTGICDDGANDISAIVTGYPNLLFESSQSTSTSYACDIYAGSKAVVASDRSDLTGDGFQINSISLTESVEAISFSDTPVDVVWMQCTVNNNAVTVTVTGVP